MFRARPKEAVEYAGISEAKLRHWKSQLEPLRKKSGNKPSYTPGDILALRLVRWVTEDVGLVVSALAPCANALFEACQEVHWDRIQHQVAVLNLPAGTLELFPRNHPLAPAALSGGIVIDIGSQVTAMRQPTESILPSIRTEQIGSKNRAALPD